MGKACEKTESLYDTKRLPLSEALWTEGILDPPA